MCKRVADLVVGDRKTALAADIGGIGPAQLLRNGEPGAVGGKRVGKFPLCGLDIANAIVGNPERMLPVGIAGVGAGETLVDCKT